MRTILHSDLNNFFASVEILYNPSLKDVPLAVCGSEDDRHGVVLAKNQIAKKYGIKTAESLWEARKKCPQLVTVEAHHNRYVEISLKVREIYSRFTDKIEPFGIDECWLDVTESKIFGDGYEIAQKISETVKREIGVTVSIGVSFNKVFAKLGSDMKKPDGITVIDEDNYKDLVWKLPCECLLFVGKATKERLNSIGIHTIGDIAGCQRETLKNLLGVSGESLYDNANGLDNSPVEDKRKEDGYKSIGNSFTDYKDLYNFEEVKSLIMLLSESVASRLRESGMGKAKTVKITITDNKLKTYGKQCKIPTPTSNAVTISECCYKLFNDLYKWDNPVRAVGVSVTDFTFGVEQMTLDDLSEKNTKLDRLDKTIDEIRKKYGNKSLRSARILEDKRLSEKDIKGE